MIVLHGQNINEHPAPTINRPTQPTNKDLLKPHIVAPIAEIIVLIVIKYDGSIISANNPEKG